MIARNVSDGSHSFGKQLSVEARVGAQVAGNAEGGAVGAAEVVSANGASSKAASPEAPSLMGASDAVTISEDGNIDLGLFNYLDKGGDARKALMGEEASGGAFRPKPNFAGMSVNRYGSMKAEIERNFADNPELRNKYLTELEKTLEDYIRLQTKISEGLAGKKEDGGDENAQELGNETDDELKAAYISGSKKVKAIIDKVMGETESAMPDEMSKAVDEYFIEAYRRVSGASDRPNAFGREAREDQKTKEIWRAIRLNIDNYA